MLLRRISKTFTNVYDFLDGDRAFRSLHTIVDIFADSKTGIEALLPGFYKDKDETYSARRLADEDRAIEDSEPDEDLEYSATVYTSAPVAEKPALNSPLFNKDELNIESNRYVVPPHYNYRINLRSPIVQIGYMAFDKI